jgi:hypothetical protein
LEGVNGEDQIMIKKFYQYMLSRGSRSEHHTISLLNLLIAFDKFLPLPWLIRRRRSWLSRIFFRWLTNRDKDEDDWETPSFLKIKCKKAIRDRPYGLTQIWHHLGSTEKENKAEFVSV